MYLRRIRERSGILQMPRCTSGEHSKAFRPVFAPYYEEMIDRCTAMILGMASGWPYST